MIVPCAAIDNDLHAVMSAGAHSSSGDKEGHVEWRPEDSAVHVEGQWEQVT